LLDGIFFERFIRNINQQKYDMSDIRKFEEIKNETKISRRAVMRVVGAGVAGLVVGGVIGYGLSLATAPPGIKETVTQYITAAAQTVTSTVTMPATTYIETITKTVTAAGPPTGIVPTNKYEEAAIRYADQIWPNTALPTKEDLQKELMWYAKASERYRGATVRAVVEAQPLLNWEGEKLAPMFEDITGIKVVWEGTEDAIVMRKAREEAEVKAGVYDLISIDQDMNGFWTWHPGTVTDLTDFMDKHPDLIDPYLDLPDNSALSLNRDPNTLHIYNFNDYQKPTVSLYRKDWFQDPAEKSEFRRKYGYELKTPREWWIESLDSGKVEDDWTIEKSLNVAEHFTRPAKEQYGCIIGLKAGYGLSYQFNDGVTHVFALPSPFVKGPPLLGGIVPACRPYSITYGVGYKGKMTILGASVERGGNMNSPQGGEMFDYVVNKLRKYAPPRSLTISHVEAHIEFTRGDCAFQHHHFAAFVPTLNSPESKVKDVYEFSPLPVSEKYWRPGFPRGYWDCEGWIITIGSKNKEAAFLLSQFTWSKAVDVYKNLYGLMPVRWSSIAHPAMLAIDPLCGGLISLENSVAFKAYMAGTDEAWPEFPAYFEAVYPVVAEGIEKGWTGQRIADAAAASLDKMLKERGYIS
jgi:glycerol transport system substrate-binding protein